MLKKNHSKSVLLLVYEGTENNYYVYRGLGQHNPYKHDTENIQITTEIIMLFFFLHIYCVSY